MRRRSAISCARDCGIWPSGTSRLGDVRGTGLIAGVDILDDARDLLEALRDRRVLAGLTGPAGNVLKIRPPLIWRSEHVEVFLDALGSALAVSA